MGFTYFYQNYFNYTYFSVPNISLLQNTGTESCRMNTGQERDSKQYTAGSCSLLTQTVIHDANVADKIALLVCLNVLAYFAVLNYFKEHLPQEVNTNLIRKSLFPLTSFP